jgi:ankyrin repeat protein
MDEHAVSALLQEGADPNQQDPELGGFRPLHLAVDIECEESCRRYDAGDEAARPRARLTRLLLSAGADPDLPDGNSRTARRMAVERGHEEALELFGGET